jgi:hypothetical protein
MTTISLIVNRRRKYPKMIYVPDHYNIRHVCYIEMIFGQGLEQARAEKNQDFDWKVIV